MSLRVNGYAVQEIRTNGAIITDIPQRLKTCDIYINRGLVEYTVEGDENQYSLTFTINGDSITYTWGDGFTCTISIIS